MFLKESQICMPGSKSLGMCLEICVIFRFDYGDARWRSSGAELWVRRGMDESTATSIAVRAGAGGHVGTDCLVRSRLKSCGGQVVVGPGWCSRPVDQSHA